MWIEAKRRSGRNENLFVFQFTSLELDYEPYIQHLTDIVPVLGNERAEDRLIQLIHRLQARCDDTYANGEVVASSFLFADEMAEMTTHMSYLLLYLDEKAEENEEMEGETRDE